MNIRWEVTDSQNRKVVLKQSTYDEHITGDHDLRDAKVRKLMESQVRRTLSSPDVIIKDTTSRLLYYNTIVIRYETRLPKIKTLKVVVDTDRSPHEVVTWTPLRKGDSIKDGVIIYERCADDLPDKQI